MNTFFEVESLLSKRFNAFTKTALKKKGGLHIIHSLARKAKKV